MIEILQQISEEINSLPDYVGKGLVELIVIIVGGVIVGWITSSYFALKAAESEVKGDIMKKKLDIYDALVVKLDEFQQEVVLSQELIKLFGYVLREDQMLWQLSSSLKNLANKYMNDWSIDRIDKTGAAILRMAIYELMYTDTPEVVVINEAIELSKKYSDDNVRKIINAVLDKIIKDR